MHVVGQNDPGIDVERTGFPHAPDGIPQGVDLRHQQIAAPIMQVDP
jgi:hypothetical protein